MGRVVCFDIQLFLLHKIQSGLLNKIDQIRVKIATGGGELDEIGCRIEHQIRSYK